MPGDAQLEKHAVPDALYRVPLFLGLPQQYLVVWITLLTSIAVAIGNGTHVVLGAAAFVGGMVAIHPKLARACEEDPLAIDIWFHWLLHEHAVSEPHPSIWDAADRVRPSIPGV